MTHHGLTSKYIGIWWGMIIGKWTWEEGSRHGATNERGIKYIDFASKHGISEVLIEAGQLAGRVCFLRIQSWLALQNQRLILT